MQQSGLWAAAITYAVLLVQQDRWQVHPQLDGNRAAFATVPSSGSSGAVASDCAAEVREPQCESTGDQECKPGSQASIDDAKTASSNPALEDIRVFASQHTALAILAGLVFAAAAVAEAVVSYRLVVYVARSMNALRHRGAGAESQPQVEATKAEAPSAPRGSPAKAPPPPKARPKAPAKAPPPPKAVPGAPNKAAMPRVVSESNDKGPPLPPQLPIGRRLSLRPKQIDAEVFSSLRELAGADEKERTPVAVNITALHQAFAPPPRTARLRQAGLERQVELLPRNTAQGLAIVLAKLHLDTAKLATSPWHLQGPLCPLTSEGAARLLEVWPKPEVLKQLTEYQEKGAALDLLRDVERQVLPLLTCPRIGPRLRLIVISSSIEERSHPARSQLGLLQTACSELRASTILRGIIQKATIIFSYVNFGTDLLRAKIEGSVEAADTEAGGICGVDVQSLPRLIETKAYKGPFPNYTMLHFAVRELLDQRPGLALSDFRMELGTLDDAVPPGAGCVNLERSRRELNYLRAELKFVREELREHRDVYEQVLNVEASPRPSRRLVKRPRSTSTEAAKPKASPTPRGVPVLRLVERLPPPAQTPRKDRPQEAGKVDPSATSDSSDSDSDESEAAGPTPADAAEVQSSGSAFTRISSSCNSRGSGIGSARSVQALGRAPTAAPVTPRSLPASGSQCRAHGGVAPPRPVVPRIAGFSSISNGSKSPLSSGTWRSSPRRPGPALPPVLVSRNSPKSIRSQLLGEKIPVPRSREPSETRDKAAPPKKQKVTEAAPAAAEPTAWTGPSTARPVPASTTAVLASERMVPVVKQLEALEQRLVEEIDLWAQALADVEEDCRELLLYFGHEAPMLPAPLSSQTSQLLEPLAIFVRQMRSAWLDIERHEQAATARSARSKTRELMVTPRRVRRLSVGNLNLSSAP